MSKMCDKVTDDWSNEDVNRKENHFFKMGDLRSVVSQEKKRWGGKGQSVFLTFS